MAPIERFLDGTDDLDMFWKTNGQDLVIQGSFMILGVYVFLLISKYFSSLFVNLAENFPFL